MVFEVTYTKGSAIIQEGNVPTAFIYLLKGVAKDSGGQLRQQGEFLALEELIMSTPVKRSVMAIEDVESLTFEPEDIPVLREKNPEVLKDLVREMVKFWVEKLGIVCKKQEVFLKKAYDFFKSKGIVEGLVKITQQMVEEVPDERLVQDSLKTLEDIFSMRFDVEPELPEDEDSAYLTISMKILDEANPVEIYQMVMGYQKKFPESSHTPDLLKTLLRNMISIGDTARAESVLCCMLTEYPDNKATFEGLMDYARFLHNMGAHGWRENLVRVILSCRDEKLVEEASMLLKEFDEQ